MTLDRASQRFLLILVAIALLAMFQNFTPSRLAEGPDQELEPSEIVEVSLVK